MEVIMARSGTDKDHDTPPHAAKPPPTRAEFAGWTLAIERRELRAPSGNRVPLSFGEFPTLRLLLEHPRQALTREQFGAALAPGVALEDYWRSLDLRIIRLRQRFEEGWPADEAQPRPKRLIVTVKAIGYMLDADVVWHSDVAGLRDASHSKGIPT
jgi:DNA-binding response OmpR family regulator